MNSKWLKMVALAAMCFCAAGYGLDQLELDVITYDEFMNNDPSALKVLETALLEKGIVGMSGIPGYMEKVERYVSAYKAFNGLSEDVKEGYAPNRDEDDTFIGYERGKEKFQREDGSWVVDDLKISFYAHYPNDSINTWPTEVALEKPFLDIGKVMSDMGTRVMEKIGLINGDTGISIDGEPRVARMLYYNKAEASQHENPYWCGKHFDHSMFTALLPAYYFQDGKQVEEPDTAGLYVRKRGSGEFKRVASDQRDILLFQVGEFGQLISNDSITATEHYVKKSDGAMERYTLALFFNPTMDTKIRSTSVLTADARYGAGPGDPCTFNHWNIETFKRFLVTDGK